MANSQNTISGIRSKTTALIILVMALLAVLFANDKLNLNMFAGESTDNSIVNEKIDCSDKLAQSEKDGLASALDGAPTDCTFMGCGEFF